MTTIKDIAAKANVSTGTVDRVIHNRPGVSEKTRERVKKILDENNFQVNQIASALAFNKTYSIAVLIPEATHESSFWSQPIKGVEKAANEVRNFRGNVSIYKFDQFKPNSFVSKFLTVVESKPDAVLIAPVFYKETIDHVQLLEELNIPYLFINVNINGLKNISFIGQHSYDSGYLAGKLMHMMLDTSSTVLIPVVRKNIDNHLSIEHRISGFKSYFSDHLSNIQLKEVTITDIEDDKNACNLLKKHLKKADAAGLFVPSSYVNQIAKYLSKLGLTSIKLIGYDVNQENIVFLKNETIDFLISQNAVAQGYDGIKILFDYIAKNVQPEKRNYSPIKLLTKENIDYI